MDLVNLFGRVGSLIDEICNKRGASNMPELRTLRCLFDKSERPQRINGLDERTLLYIHSLPHPHSLQLSFFSSLCLSVIIIMARGRRSKIYRSRVSGNHTDFAAPIGMNHH